jgi:outer membrane biosynthesis protein TonB
MERMRIPAPARWIGLALLGMLIAAAISIAASRVASQQIGLASEPISAGDALAPRAQEQKAPTRPRPRHRVPPTHPNRSVPPTQPTEPAQPVVPPATEPAQPVVPPATEPAQPVVPPATEPAPSAHRDNSGGSTGGDGEHGGGGGGGGGGADD